MPLVIDEKGQVCVAGISIDELADQFGTPLYVLDEQAIRDRCREYRREFESRWPRVGVHYAAKALLTIAVAQIIEEEGLEIDCASGGELFVALRADFPASRIHFHGSNKSMEELRFAVESGIGSIIVDNFLELERLEAMGAEVEILLRMAPGVDPTTHPSVRTGQSDTKFGFQLTDAGQAIRLARKLKLAGFHCHIGSQITRLDEFREAVRLMAEFVALAEEKYKFGCSKLNIGGGLGIRYLSSDDVPTIAEYAEVVTSELRGVVGDQIELQVEPGRSIVGEAGYIVYTVGAIKEIPGVRTYLSVDGGVSDNQRPQLYGSRYTYLAASKAHQAATHRYRLVGKHCENDLLEDAIELPKMGTGDRLVALSAGAYTYSMSSNYNCYPRPAMALVDRGKARLIVERETHEQLIVNQKPLR